MNSVERLEEYLLIDQEIADEEAEIVPPSNVKLIIFTSYNLVASIGKN